MKEFKEGQIYMQLRVLSPVPTTLPKLFKIKEIKNSEIILVNISDSLNIINLTINSLEEYIKKEWFCEFND